MQVFKLFFFSIACYFSGLYNLRYSVELDKGKESDALRRMFFWNPSTKKKSFIMSGTYNISTQNQFYSLPTETVYLLVRRLFF